MRESRLTVLVLLLTSFLSLAGCPSGDNGEPPLPVATYTIGGTVSGLVGTGLELVNYSVQYMTDYLTITASGDFTFTLKRPDGDEYSVYVLKQPKDPSQTCTVNNGIGSISGANVTNVSIVCSTNTYSIGGTVSGLTGTGLVLQNNSDDDLDISINGPFAFSNAVADTAGYSVTVLTQPAGQICLVRSGSGTVSAADVTGVKVNCLTPSGNVEALYNTSGSGWNDYIADDGLSFALASDTACNTAFDTACLHAGEMRAYWVPARSTCLGLTAADSLGVFDWTCEDSAGTARLASTGLKEGRGLIDLLDFATPDWKDNSLTVNEGGSPLETTTPSKWWANPVVANTTGGSLDAAGMVYVVPSDTIAAYDISADSVSLVAAPGVVINGPGAGSYVIKATSMDFLWVEGMAMNAAGDSGGVYWDQVMFSTMRDLSAEYADTGTGITIWFTDNIRISNIAASNNLYGVSISATSSGNTISGVTASNNYIGVILTGSDNTLTGVTASSNNYGADLSGSDNMISGVTASNNTYYGLDSSGSFNTLSGVTASNNGYAGIRLYYANDNTVSSVAASNNWLGVYIRSSNNTYSDLTADNSISLFNSSDNYFTGLLQAGSCKISNSPTITITNPGLDDDSDPSDQGNDDVHNGLCTEQGSSDFGTAVTGITLASSFVGKVSADDSANSSDTGGAALITDFADAFDWTSLENPFRAWGRDGSGFPSDNNQGRLGCVVSNFEDQYTNQVDCETALGTWYGSARIWDWSLRSTDTVIRNVLPLPTGNDTLTHTWSDLSTSTFLRRAVEITGDLIGNDDLLCESDETCLYTPNMGSYQGHGNLISAGYIGYGGTLENITLLMYETNGY